MSAAVTGGDITNLQLLSEETIEMKRKILVVALSLMATMLLATSSFAQSCSGFTGANVQFVAAGSSAQFNSVAFAAQNLLGTHFNFWAAASNIFLQDTRFGIANSNSPSDSAKVWVAWDDNADCSVYVYYSIDSTVGVRDFFAYNKVTATTSNGTVNIVQGAVYSTTSAATNGASTGWTSTCNGGSIVNAGQPPCQRNDVVNPAPVSLPTAIALYLQVPPSPATKTSLPPVYCGTSTKTTTVNGFWCTINAGATDIRPEDALYATTRALSAYNTTNGLTGLGYASTSCGAATALQGCDIYDSFGQKRGFHVLSFKISGTDPKTLAALPKYATLTTGAAPIVVFVNDADTAAGGFGSKSGGNYVFNDINRKTLALLYEGTSHCTGDLLASSPLSGGIGSGKPVQVVQREPLSGTYNTFEFNAVRTVGGSAATSAKQNTKSALQWISGDSSGQELGIDPTQNFGSGTGCPGTSSLTGSVPDGSSACGDPLFQQVGSASTACNGAGFNQSIRVRAVGGGDLVKATIGTFNSLTSAGSPGWSVTNGIGYSFWSYGNLAPTASGCATNSGAVTCSTYKAHYLTVDGIDPLFTTEGGAGDSAYGGSNNPNGAFHAPQCNLSADPIRCFSIPFTHVADGKYPIWSLLRMVSFSNVFNSGTSGPLKLATPPGVLNMIANAQLAAGDPLKNIDDFVPFLTNLTNSGTLTAPAWTGDLNLGVFRSHYKATGGSVNPFNGHATCASFTGVSLAGGNAGQPTCLVDAGSDMGGSVLTVQEDIDFNLDFGSLFNSGNYELYNLHQ